MKKEELQQNMKDRMQQFEDGGLRLLKKGQKGIVHAIFSRFGLVLLLMLLQVGVLWSVFRWFGGLLPHYFGGSVAMSAFMVVYILNSEMDNSAKITWMVTIAILPVVGVPLFFYVKSNIGHNALKKRVTHLTEEARGLQPQPLAAAQELAEADPGAASLARYLHGKGGGFSVYRNTEVTYFPGGEAKFEELLRQLEKAEKYIFLEYFIIDEGLMWGKILEVLARKAAEGVDVRVMYDGTCEFTTLPRDYPSRLEKLGIQCRVFSPVQPFVSTHYNYRDHRKILVIDGKVGFTGGVNLADEYINHIEKYGRWKDAAVMLEGEAVRPLTILFLEMWSILREPEFEKFLSVPPHSVPAKGFAAPYGDCPLDGERVGEMVYIDLLNRAKRYIHIMTPYLILDGELETALKFAAERGVDVHLILPPCAGQEVRLCAGEDALQVSAGLGREDQRVAARFRPREGLCGGRQRGRGGYHKPRLPQSLPPLRECGLDEGYRLHPRHREGFPEDAGILPRCRAHPGEHLGGQSAAPSGRNFTESYCTITVKQRGMPLGIPLCFTNNPYPSRSPGR